MNIYHLAPSYDNKFCILVDVPGDDNCIFRVLVESYIIPISDSKTFRSDLSIRTKTLLKMDHCMVVKFLIMSTTMKSPVKVEQLRII